MKHEHKSPFMKRMVSLEAPLRMRLELTRRCNLNCIHCKALTDNKPQGELSAADIARLLDSAREAGVIDISISGGEVFARPDIEDILREIFFRDFRLHIQTNGSLISESTLALLAQNAKKILRVSFSVYSADPATHDAITRSPGSHAKTMANIFRARDAGLKVFCFTLLMKENLPGVDALKAFFEKNGLQYKFNSLIIPREDGCTVPLHQRIPDEELEALPIDWYAYMHAADVPADESLPPDAFMSAICPVGRFAFVTCTGDVIACSLLRESAGNIKDKSFMEIWRESPVLKRIRDIRLGQLECFSCERFPLCKPCIGIAMLEHGDPLKRPTEICRLTNALLDKTKP